RGDGTSVRARRLGRKAGQVPTSIRPYEAVGPARPPSPTESRNTAGPRRAQRARRNGSRFRKAGEPTRVTQRQKAETERAAPIVRDEQHQTSMPERDRHTNDSAIPPPPPARPRSR